jgi:TRAP transporter TAXI family solute receptor
MKPTLLALLMALAVLPLAAGNAAAQRTRVVMGTATPGGGFPLYGGAAAEAINETDSSLLVEPRNTKGSAENIPLLEEGKLDIALVAGEPAYEAFAGIGRAPSKLPVIAAIYSNPGMFVVRGDSPARSLRDLVGKPIAWGTSASGLTLLARYVVDGLGLDREKDFTPVYLERAGDGPAMVLDGRVAALWGGGAGWPGFTTVMQAGGRFIGLSAEEADRIRAKHNFLKPLTKPAGTYPGQSTPVASVGSWSYILARPTLEDDVAYRLARALDRGHAALVKRLDQGRETTPQNTLAAAPSPERIHPGVQRYLRELGVMR